MADHLKSRRAWDWAHQETPAPDLPEDNVIPFAAHIPPGSAVLDAGCGRGRSTIYLAGLGHALTGCDVSRTALEKARTRARQAGAMAEFQVADLAHLPYPADTFAAAICVHVLPYHLQAGIAAAVGELRRVLQPGGRLYFDLLDQNDVEYGHGEAVEVHTFLDPDGVPIHFSSRQDVDVLLRGFAPHSTSVLEAKSATAGRVRMVWAVTAIKPSPSA